MKRVDELRDDVHLLRADIAAIKATLAERNLSRVRLLTTLSTCAVVLSALSAAHVL